MKKIFSVLLSMIGLYGISQNPVQFPDTLTGTNFNLTIHYDSVQFLEGNKTLTNAFNQYAYLGPTLILKKDDVVTMHVINQLDDTTTVHWHGLHVPASDDGGPHTVVLSGETWSPEFEIMNHAALYWYHPHLHMKTGKQAMRGAAGLIIVRDDAESALNLPRKYGMDDFPLVIQSQQFDQNNQILWRGMHDSILLVNGTTDPMLEAPSQVVRFRLLNASQERNFNFGFSGNRQFFVIGNDGGLLNQAVPVTRIRLSPGERAEILLDLSASFGQTLYLMSYASEFGNGIQGGTPMPGMDTAMYSPINGIDFNIMKIQVIQTLDNPVTSIPSSLVTITPWSQESSDFNRTINITADNMMNMDGPFYFNDELFDMERIDQEIPLDNIEIWTLTNQTMVAHPFHMHDIQFFVLDRDGIIVNPEEQGSKDVVMVGPNETVRFITRFEDFADSTIPYMYHCHILMHEDDGMMGQFTVVDNSTSVFEWVLSSEIFHVFPNPVSNGSIAISFEKDLLDFPLIVSLYDLDGRTLLKMEVFNDNSLVIPVQSLKSGVYFMKLGNNSFTQTEKIVKY